MNPFVDLSRAELAEALTRAVDRLEHRGRRTAEERASFAEELRHLLIAAAGRLNVSRFIPQTPAFELDRSPEADPIDVYMAFVRRESACARFDALQQAAEGAMAPHELVLWLDARPAATTTDDGCQAALADLVELKRLRRHRRAGR